MSSVVIEQNFRIGIGNPVLAQSYAALIRYGGIVLAVRNQHASAVLIDAVHTSI